MKPREEDRPATLAELRASEERQAAALNAAASRLACAIIEAQADGRRLAEAMATRDDIDRTLARFDYLMGKDKDDNRSIIIFDHILKGYEQRIKRLEGHG